MSILRGNLHNPTDTTPPQAVDMFDIVKMLNIMAGREPMPSPGTVDHDLMNVNELWSFVGAGFLETVKVLKGITAGTLPEYNPPLIDLTTGNKGTQVAGILSDSFMASFPTAFDYGTWGVDDMKEIGWTKVYDKNGTYQESYDVRPSLELLKTKTFNYLEHGQRSLTMGENFAASTVFYNGTSGAVWVYEKYQEKFVFRHEIPVSECTRAPEVEIFGDWLFVGNPIAGKVFVYSLADLQPNFNSAGPNTITPKATLESSAQIPEWYGSSLHCSGTHLFVGVSDGAVTSGGITVNCGYVDVYKLMSVNYIEEWTFFTKLIPWDLSGYQLPGTYGDDDVAIKFGEQTDHKPDTSVYATDVTGVSTHNVSDGYVAVGAPDAYTSDTSRREGAVYIFKLTATGSTYVQKIEYDESFVGNLDNVNEVGSFQLGQDVAFKDNFDLYVALNPLHGSHVIRYEKAGESWSPEELTKIADQRVGGTLITNGVDVVYGGPGQIRVFSPNTTQTLDNQDSLSDDTEFPKEWGRPPPVQLRNIVPLQDNFGHGSATLREWIDDNKHADENLSLLAVEVESSGEDLVEVTTPHGILVVKSDEPLQYKSRLNSKIIFLAKPESNLKSVTWWVNGEMVSSDNLNRVADSSLELSIDSDTLVVAKFSDPPTADEILPPAPKLLNKLSMSSSYDDAVCMVTVDGKSKFFKGNEEVNVSVGDEVSLNSMSDEYYDFVGLSGDIDWLRLQRGTMPRRDVKISFDFKEVEPVVESTEVYDIETSEDELHEEIEVKSPDIFSGNSINSLQFFEHTGGVGPVVELESLPTLSLSNKLHITVQATDSAADVDEQLEMVKDTLLPYYNNDESLYKRRVTILDEDTVNYTKGVAGQTLQGLSGVTSPSSPETGQIEISKKEIMPVALIEAGSSYRMFGDVITNKSHPIEELGNGEYRVYFNSLVRPGRVRKSSPAYFTTLKSASQPLDYRSVRVGYNSAALIKDIEYIRHDYSEVHIVTTWIASDGVLNLVTNRSHGLVDGEIITIHDSSADGLLNGSHEVTPYTDSIFSIKFENDDADESDLTGITAIFDSLYGSKIYCNVTDFTIGDLVVFDYAGGEGKTHKIVDISKDERGVYFLVGGLTSLFAKKVVRSHSHVRDGDLVEFGYENHLSYYQVAGVNTQSDSLWLTYEPDVMPAGRENNMVSFIQFYHKDMSIYGRGD